MDAESLQVEIALLPHASRQGRRAEIARLAASGGLGSAEASGTLATPGEGDGYQRRLALSAAWAACDATTAVRHMADPSRTARAAARRLTACFCAELWAVRTLGALPDTRPDALILLADPGGTRPWVRDTALRAPGRRDAGNGLPDRRPMKSDVEMTPRLQEDRPPPARCCSTKR